MKLFSEIEKTIERGFKRWTEKMLGQGATDELMLVHHGILEEIEGKVQTAARGRRVFPYARVTVTLVAADPEKQAVYRAAFLDGGRLESDVREALDSVGCEVPRGFGLEVRTAETGAGAFHIDYGVEAPAPAAEKAIAAPATPAKLVVVKGKAAEAEYALSKSRTNLGRLAEITDAEEHIIRRNEVVFEEGADEANSTVSRSHAHIKLDTGEYRICDDGSEFGTRVFRDGRPVEVPQGNRRGERLRDGDEIYLGRACLRFER